MAKIELEHANLRWGQNRRLEFIDFRLRWNRNINRADLVDFFRISNQQASADLGRYAEIAPNNMAYDKSLKAYLATGNFEPIMDNHDAQSYLSELLRLSNGTLSTDTSFIGWQPPHDIVQYPSRAIDTSVFLRLHWAIRDREELSVRYQSMRRASPSTRWLTPHALAFDGQRWHTRAWCKSSNEFRDFVISRIQQVYESRQATKCASEDTWWHTYIEILVNPRDGLTDAQRRAVETDFGMTNGVLRLTCRKALAFYILRQMQLDRSSDLPPHAQPVELMNRDQLDDVIIAAQKTPEHTISTNPSKEELGHESV